MLYPCERMGYLDWEYVDKDFPPDDVSLGKLSGDTANAASGQMGSDIVWLRGPLIGVDATKMTLFTEGVNPDEICQGALGNCWLLAAAAALANQKSAINRVFSTHERNPRGKYHLRLYNNQEEAWEDLFIDDNIPCDRKIWEKDGKAVPVFSKPSGEALWVLLLEKAFAKSCGSYASIEGGQTLWAVQAMTGDPARMFMLNENVWAGYDMVSTAKENDADTRRSVGFKPRSENIDCDTMFGILEKYSKLGSILSASGANGKNGLVAGHAYSILKVHTAHTDPSWLATVGVGITDDEKVQLLQIRNPWGHGEWKGDWSDKSELWETYPTVAKQVGFENADDGAFWMTWQDYMEHYSKVGIVHRTIDITSLELEFNQGLRCGPSLGCMKGCCQFWCCCKGITHLYFPVHSSDETVAGSRYSRVSGLE